MVLGPTKMNTICHLCSEADWQAAQEAGSYRGDTLDSEGFIHCSLPRQVQKVANFVFVGRQILLLLFIDEEKVEAPVKYEQLAGADEDYPHIYGELNLSAVVEVKAYQADKLGKFPACPQ